MQKRSKFDSNFPREDNDFYRTIDPKCYHVLNDHLEPGTTFVEPCVGVGDLVYGLEGLGHKCTYMSDLIYRPSIPNGAVFEKDALTLTADECSDADFIITNPPWNRPNLHSMIRHFVKLKPTWLLFDSDWANTKQAAEYIEKYCVFICVVGRVKWVEGTTNSSLKDCSWYLFEEFKAGNNETAFFPRRY